MVQHANMPTCAGTPRTSPATRSATHATGGSVSSSPAVAHCTVNIGSTDDKVYA
jgi:hypothetical protein